MGEGGYRQLPGKSSETQRPERLVEAGRRLSTGAWVEIVVLVLGICGVITLVILFVLTLAFNGNAGRQHAAAYEHTRKSVASRLPATPTSSLHIELDDIDEITETFPIAMRQDEEDSWRVRAMMCG